MEMQTQRSRQARGAISGGIQAVLPRKRQTGFAHSVSNLSPVPAIATEHVAAEQDTVAGLSVQQTPVAKEAAQGAGSPIELEQPGPNAIGLNHQERLNALDRHLMRPYPYLTAFYLIDTIDRLTRGGVRPLDRQELMAHAAQPGNVCPMRMGIVLSAAVRAGALQRCEPQSGREVGYQITDIGKRYLDQAKAIRVALWKLNPQLSIAEICAIVQVEGGDSPSDLITRVKDEDALKAESRHKEPRATAMGIGMSDGGQITQDLKPMTASSGKSVEGQPMATKAQPIQPHLHPLWAGLTAPLQRLSYPDKG